MHLIYKEYVFCGPKFEPKDKSIFRASYKTMKDDTICMLNAIRFFQMIKKNLLKKDYAA